MRRVALEGVTLRLDAPAAGLSLACEPVSVNADENAATLTLSFPREARIPPRSTLIIRAESSRAGLPVYAQASLRLETP